MEYYIDYAEGQDFKLAILVSKRGLVYVGDFTGQVEDEILARISQGQELELVSNQAITKPYVDEIQAYLRGQVQDFKLSLDFTYGTAFQKQVWSELLKIPYGQTTSYGEIARAIGRPKAYRAVGTAIGLNPMSIVVPCHRVLNSQGQLNGYRGGLAMKDYLLKLENQGLGRKDRNHEA